MILDPFSETCKYGWRNQNCSHMRVRLSGVNVWLFWNVALLEADKPKDQHELKVSKESNC